MINCTWLCKCAAEQNHLLNQQKSEQRPVLGLIGSGSEHIDSSIRAQMRAQSYLCGDGAVDPHGAERQPYRNSVDGHDVGHWTLLGLIQLLRPALARLSPPRRRAPVVQQVFIQFVNGLHKVRLSLHLVYMKDPTARKGLNKGWINVVYQCKLIYLFAQGLVLVYIWFTSKVTGNFLAKVFQNLVL